MILDATCRRPDHRRTAGSAARLPARPGLGLVQWRSLTCPGTMWATKRRPTTTRSERSSRGDRRSGRAHRSVVVEGVSVALGDSDAARVGTQLGIMKAQDADRVAGISAGCSGLQSVFDDKQSTDEPLSPYRQRDGARSGARDGDGRGLVRGESAEAVIEVAASFRISPRRTRYGSRRKRTTRTASRWTARSLSSGIERRGWRRWTEKGW